MGKKKNTWIGPLFMLVGAALAAGYLWIILIQLQPYQWPQTNGTVISSNIRDEKKSSKDGTKTYSYPVIHYKYHVDGREYQSDVYIRNYKSASGSLVAKSIDYAPAVVRRYPPGQSVTVYYYPDDPSIAALERRVQSFVIVSFIIGLFFVVAGFLIYRGMRLDQKFLEKQMQQQSKGVSANE